MLTMSSADSLRAALSTRVAAGWIALGCQLEGVAQTSVVDIEALVAATARLDERLDARTRGVALDWCVRYGVAISSVRLARVADELGAVAPVAAFGARVAASGGPRWPVAVGSAEPSEVRDRVVVRDLSGDARLVWRLRAAFGVSSRADILAALLLFPGSRSISELARRTRYAKRGVAAAVESMALAGIVEVERVGREDRVRLTPGSPVRTWVRKVEPVEPVDEVSRWLAAITALDVIEATAAARPEVAAVERRVSADALRAAVIAGRLPRIDTTVTGSAFAAEYDRWADLVAQDLSTVR